MLFPYYIHQPQGDANALNKYLFEKHGRICGWALKSTMHGLVVEQCIPMCTVLHVVYSRVYVFDNYDFYIYLSCMLKSAWLIYSRHVYLMSVFVCYSHTYIHCCSYCELNKVF